MPKNWNHEIQTKNSIHHHPILSPIPISIPIFLPIFLFFSHFDQRIKSTVDVSASDLQWKEKDRPRIHRLHSHLISSLEMVGFFSLCLCRKKVVSSSNKHDQDENTKKSRDRFARETEESINDNDEEEKEKEEETQKTIPLPPGMTNKKTSAEADSVPPTNYRKTRTKSMAAMPSSSSSSSKSSKKLLVSLSMKVRPGGKKEKVLKHEDSIWKKTIILGERCRVPDLEDDAVCYDENGNKISTYHPRLSNSVPVSRQNSFIDDDAIPKHQRHRHRHRREGNCSSSSSSSATGHN